MANTDSLLNELKRILGYSTDKLDNILTNFINAGKKDLKMVGIKEDLIVETDPLIFSALTSYALSMVDTYEYRELSANAYDKQKDALRHYSEYTVEED